MPNPSLLRPFNAAPKLPNITPPYAKGRRMDANQKMRVFPNTPKPLGPGSVISPPAVSSGNPPTLNKKSAFKAGFLSYVADKGLTPEMYFDRVKRAFIDPASLVSAGTQGIGAGAGLVGSLASGGALAGILAPLLTGTATGSMRELFSTPSPESPEVLRKLEQIGLYKRLTDEIKARTRPKMAGAEKQAGVIAVLLSKNMSGKKRKHKH